MSYVHHHQRGVISFDCESASFFFQRDVPFAMEWKRPHELTEDPKLFDGGSSRFDINQGELGDCWLLAALANLTMNKKLLYQVHNFSLKNTNVVC